MGLIYNCGNGFKKISFAKKNMGLDAYLCCPGPSLKNIDPETLKGRGRKIFGINTTYPFVKPDIWLGMDKVECYDRNLLYEPFIKIFRAPLEKQLFWDDKRVSEYPETYFATIKEPEKGKTMFNFREHYAPFVWHKSTLMVALHTMIWMGAKDIYLAGCDLGGNTDYYDGARLTDEQRLYNRRLYKSQVKHLKELYEIGKKHNINLHSVTPDSPINDFMDYIPIEEAIKNSEEKTKFKNNDTSIKHVLDIPKETTVVCVYNVSNNYNNDEYVYKLKESVDKHLPGMDFICLTNKEDLRGVKTKKLKYNWRGVFSKLEMFEHFKEDRYLYIDLSCVVKDGLASLTRFNKFTMIEDFVNPDVRSSAVMGWEGDFSFITEKFKKDPEKYMKEYAPLEERDDYKEEFKKRGKLFLSGKEWISCVDQKFIEDTVGLKNIDTWKKEYISSYRLSDKDWIEKSKIVNFHGKPKPHQVDWDPYRPEISKKEPKLCVIVPTRGDRSDLLGYTKKMIENQTIQPEMVYIIDYSPKNEYNDQIDRVNKGVELAEKDGMERVIIFEDDDYYPSNYIEMVLNEWNDEELIGGYYYSIYHLNSRKHLEVTVDSCDGVSPLHSTSFKIKTYKKFLESGVIERNESGYIKNLDTFIWNWAEKSKIKRKQIKKKLVLSIKHNFGHSISLYHKDKTWETRGVSDSKLEYLKEWVKDADLFSYYTNFYYGNKETEMKNGGKILHITNWGIWGGVQSVVLSITKEYTEYEHSVFVINRKNETQDCIRNYLNNGIRYYSYGGKIKEGDVKGINPDLIFLHSTMASRLEDGGEWLKNYKTIRVHHGWNLGELNHIDLNWFVSDFVYNKLNYPITKHFILPPVTYVKDYLDINRPERKPVVGRIQSQTAIGGKPFPQTFYNLIEKLDTDLFIVGPDDPSIKNVIKHNNIEAGKMIEYLKEVDLFVIWQDKIETWCLVATEANLSGIPVVARRMNDGLTEQLNKSGGGVLVDTEEEFIDAVNKLLKDNELRNKMAIKGKDWLVENANTKLLRGYTHKLLNE